MASEGAKLISELTEEENAQYGIFIDGRGAESETESPDPLWQGGAKRFNEQEFTPR